MKKSILRKWKDFRFDELKKLINEDKEVYRIEAFSTTKDVQKALGKIKSKGIEFRVGNKTYMRARLMDEGGVAYIELV